MSGYAATAVLRQTPVQTGRALQPQRDRADGDLDRDVAVVEAHDLTLQPMSLQDRVYYLREAWSQTTFYLFDPQSWR